ncbi:MULTISPECIES: FadR/GntR family transcriptional regulator [Enterobacterales]|jgi:DNA-binding FadR family transcriptional regulator|uniref:FadR/GntR family transcriptional regulator n=1 Tax=Enterobacterales TaxID=91347 RepID=UPI0005370D6A|nr:FadR/GntR family transcriptional regulator [Enterobacter cancerogenus]KGT87655.1 GntR family transcriptional regulator [Enterobacter cancerogenus]
MQFAAITSGQRGLDVHIAGDLAQKILSGTLKAGDVLPSEVELCSHFGVSRTAVREALKLLSSKGLIESRPKLGTHVRDRTYWNLLDVQLLEWMQGIESTAEMYQQFLDFREAIEPQAARLAALHATQAQRTELSLLFREMIAVCAASKFDLARWLEADSAFHRLIFHSTDNCFYIPFGNLLETIFKCFFTWPSSAQDIFLDEHRKIYEAIMIGDADAAHRASMNLMLNSTQPRL